MDVIPKKGVGKDSPNAVTRHYLLILAHQYSLTNCFLCLIMPKCQKWTRVEKITLLRLLLEQKADANKKGLVVSVYNKQAENWKRQEAMKNQQKKLKIALKLLSAN